LRCAFPARPAVRKHREKFGGSREEDISAPPQEPQTHARISQANADAGWARSSPPPAAQRAPSAHGVGSQEVGVLIAAGSAGSAEQRRERLPRAARVRLRSDYLTIQNRGRRVSGTNLMVFAVSGTGRMGITVSRKVGGAVVRNRVKRRLRHLVRPHLDRLPAGTDIVVRALPAAATKAYADLQVDLDAALSAALHSDRTHAREGGGR